MSEMPSELKAEADSIIAQYDFKDEFGYYPSPEELDDYLTEESSGKSVLFGKGGYGPVMSIFRKATWEPYVGPQGGEGWRNTETDEIEYSDEPPGNIDTTQLNDDQLDQLREVFSEQDLDLDDYIDGQSTESQSQDELIDSIEVGSIVQFDFGNGLIEGEIISSLSEDDYGEFEIMYEDGDKEALADYTLEDFLVAVDGQSVDEGTDATDQTSIDAYSHYDVDSDFGKRAAKAVYNDNATDVKAHEWANHYAEIDDQDLFIDALKQIEKGGGSKTAKKRIRSRLRGFGLSPEEINKTINSFPGPEEGITAEEATTIDNIPVRMQGGTNITDDQKKSVNSLVNDVSTEELEEYIDGEYVDVGFNRAAKTALWYRSDSSIDISAEDVANIDVQTNASEEELEKINDGIEQTLSAMNPEMAAQTFGMLREVNVRDISGSVNGNHSFNGKISIDPSADDVERVMSHEIAHQVHKLMGLKTQNYPSSDEFDWNSDPRDNDFGTPRDLVADENKPMFDTIHKVEKNWENYQSNDVEELRPYQKRHGVEYAAVTFAHWVQDRKKVEMMDGGQCLFWDAYAGDGNWVDNIHSIDDLQEGDKFEVNGRAVEITSIEDGEGIGEFVHTGEKTGVFPNYIDRAVRYE